MRSIQVSYSQSCHGTKYFISSNPLEEHRIIKQIITLHKLLCNFLMLCKLSIKRTFPFIVVQRTLISFVVHYAKVSSLIFYALHRGFCCTQDFVLQRILLCTGCRLCYVDDWFSVQIQDHFLTNLRGFWKIQDTFLSRIDQIIKTSLKFETSVILLEI